MAGEVAIKIIMRVSLVVMLVAGIIMTNACAQITKARMPINARPPVPKGLLLWDIFLEEEVLAEMSPILNLPSEELLGEGFMIEGVGWHMWHMLTIESRFGSTHAANKKSDYTTEKTWLTACLAQAQDSNLDAEAYNKHLENRLAEYKSDGKAKNPKMIAKELKVTEKVMAVLDQEIAIQKLVINSRSQNSQTKGLQILVESLIKQRQRMKQSKKFLDDFVSINGIKPVIISPKEGIGRMIL